MKKIIQLVAIIGIMTLSNLNIKAQVDIATHAWSTGFHVGWNTSHNLDFKIGTTPTPLMSLITTGDLNIFNATTSPIDKNAYQIGGYSVLWHNGIISNIYVGIGAGSSSTSGLYNTLVGNGAGNSLTSGLKNTFIGYEASKSATAYSNNTDDNTEYPGNVAVGFQALYSNVDQITQTAIGYKALYSYHQTASDNPDPATNTACGYKALYSTQAYGGCAFGYMAGISNTRGCSLVAIGEEAAQNNTEGNDNTAIGESSLHHNRKLSGNVAIGAEALEFQDYNPSVTCTTGTYGCVNSFNVAVGNKALDKNNPTSDANGIENTAIGANAGATNFTGYDLSFLGFKADICPACSSVALNNAAAIGANAITSNSNEMILGNNSVYVGIGYSGVAAFPPGKLSVDKADRAEKPTIAGFFHNGDETSDATFTFQKKAVYAYCDGLFANESGGWFLTNIGGDFEAGNAEESNIAVRGRTGRLHVENNGLYGYGGMFEAIGSENDDIGVWTSSDGSGRNTNYGIYASAPIGTCHDGGAGSCTDAAGYFNGDVYTTSHAYFTSDVNLKDHIQPIQNATSVINSLNPKTFTFRTNQFPYLNLPYGNQDGLIAQEVKSVLPQLVSSFKAPARMDSIGNMDTTGTNTPFMSVNYIGIIPYLIGAAKEQSHNIDSLKSVIDTLKMNDSLMSVRMDQLEQLINDCCSASGGSSHRVRNPIDVELGSENSIILNQNDPNPFAEQTHITYSVPVDVKEAKIIFFDNSGHVLQTVIINDRGNGQINVYGEKLSSGIYSYTLLADGKVIDTKKMVCNK